MFKWVDDAVRPVFWAYKHDAYSVSSRTAQLGLAVTTAHRAGAVSAIRLPDPNLETIWDLHVVGVHASTLCEETSPENEWCVAALSYPLWCLGACLLYLTRARHGGRPRDHRT